MVISGGLFDLDDLEQAALGDQVDQDEELGAQDTERDPEPASSLVRTLA